ncbi:hypothetical protein MPSEU_000065900 [Mayamaea pseudoterrestris]|nr:hypothetical protein MPSEU_000065900 [Mayamaea pseudoterrestris]
MTSFDYEAALHSSVLTNCLYYILLMNSLIGVQLKWERGVSLCHFVRDEIPKAIREKSKAKDGASLGVFISDSFVEHYLCLDESDTVLLLSALGATPINHLCLFEFFLAVDSGLRRPLEEKHAHLDRLYECLDSITTIKSAEITAYGGANGLILPGRVIKRMKTIDTIRVARHRYQDDSFVPEIVQGLAQHPCIKSVTMKICSRFYSSFIPIVLSLPLLEEVVVEGNGGEWGLPAALEPGEAQAIANLLAVDAIDVSIKSHAIGNDESYHIVCDGIAGSLARSLTLDDILIGNDQASSLIQAITASGFKHLSFGNIFLMEPMEIVGLETESDSDGSDDDSDLSGHEFASTVLLNELLRLLPTMQQLEELDCTCYQLKDVEAKVRLMQVATLCPRLRALQFHISEFTTSLDEALAECLRANSNLEKLHINGFCSDDEAPTQRFPALLGALKTNYKMKFIVLPKVVNAESLFPGFPWDQDMLTEMNVLLRLNRCGRGELKEDPGNARKAVKVLEQVVDDVDCILVFLRDNLFMFG